MQQVASQELFSKDMRLFWMFSGVKESSCSGIPEWPKHFCLIHLLIWHSTGNPHLTALQCQMLGCCFFLFKHWAATCPFLLIRGSIYLTQAPNIFLNVRQQLNQLFWTKHLNSLHSQWGKKGIFKASIKSPPNLTSQLVKALISWCVVQKS